jgi:hypothetical protein
MCSGVAPRTSLKDGDSFRDWEEDC